MSVVVLDPVNNPEKWHQYLAKLPASLNDAYFFSRYLHLNRVEDIAAPKCFVYSNGSDCWFYPFLLRRVPRLQGISATCFDIETQYGYGGPLSTSEERSFIEEANEEFSRWCVAEGVVAEFVRFHPLIDNHRLVSSMQLLEDRETVSLDLAAITETENPFDAKTNSMLRRAERSGLSCEVSSSEADFADFVRLYKGTMVRLNASDFYFFSDRYFRDLLAFTQEHGFLVVAKADGAVIAAAVFMKGTRFLHYHLSATDIANRIPGVMNSVLLTAALHGKSAQLQALHLGGGRTRGSDDSLLKFKRTMSTGSHKFMIGKRVHNREIYGELRAAWEKQYPHLVDAYGVQLLCYHNLA